MEKLCVISVNYLFIPSDVLFQILDVCHMQLVHLCLKHQCAMKRIY